MGCGLVLWQLPPFGRMLATLARWRRTRPRALSFRLRRACALCWLAHRPPGDEERNLGGETTLRRRSSRPGSLFSRRRAFQAGPAVARLRHDSRNDLGVPSAPHARVASRVSPKRRRNAALSKAAVAYFQNGTVMSSQEDIAAMQVRIAKAESERDSWRVSGMQEKYLEAYSMVEALELQLERLRQAART
jgi:hypothetical protein